VEDSSESAPRAGTAEGQNAAEAEVGDSLADAARDEREVGAARLREELNRDPTDEEIDEWLRRHTEGY
jgi:DNA-directed RNA polymerase specialized sigma subunit